MITAAPSSAILLVSLLLACGDKPGTSTGDDTGSTTATSGVDEDADGWSVPEDCDDNNAAVNPDASEVCNDRDDDCDLLVDDDDDSLDSSTQSTFYPDADEDGFGLDTEPILACTQPAGTTTWDGDCDDTNAAAWTGAPEICDDIDNDCNGLIDDADDGLDLSTASTFFTDADGDGFGSDETKVTSCVQGSDTAAVGGDCDDGDDSVFPGADEVCDGVDNDCDEATTEDGVITVAGANQDSLATALDTAAEGDQILICPGSYSGPFSTTKKASLLGVGGADVTTLTARGGTILTAGGDLDIEGLTLSGGVGDITGALDAYTAGVPLTISIDSCIFDSNRGAYGGAVLGYNDSTVNVSNSTFSGNTASASGGAIYLEQGTITASTFSGNEAVFGGAFMVDSGTVTVDADTLITTNTASADGTGAGGYGGGVLVNGGTLNLDAATQITANNGVFGGGVMVLSVEDATTGALTLGTLTGGEYTLNTASASGGGAVIAGTGASASGLTISQNTATWGGALSMESTGNTLSDSDLSNNTATDYGGGIIFPTDSTDVTLTSVILSGNDAPYGGAVAADGTADITFESCEITANTADTYAGAFYLSSSSVTLDGGEVSSNVATDGDGGGAWLYLSELFSVDVDWGAGGGDNSPDDVYIEAADTGSTGTAYSYGRGETFACDSTECL